MSQSPVVLPNDLITELLSFLPVKSLLRFTCVSQYWKTLISAPPFVKLHLKRSATRNPQFTLVVDRSEAIPRDPSYGSDDEYDPDCSVVTYPVSCLLDNPSFTLFDDTSYHAKDKGCSQIIGSCDGLILFAGNYFDHEDAYEKYWLCVWNPATRTRSKKLEIFHYERETRRSGFQSFSFAFGCDNSSGRYKVVAVSHCCDRSTTKVRVLSLGDNIWRDIESFPVIPLDLGCRELSMYGSVYLSGTLNWIAFTDFNYFYRLPVMDIGVVEFVIVSLDLGTETYNQYKIPRGSDIVPPAAPTISVLGGCLCFSYSYQKTELIIWKMEKFKVDDSWSQFLKISYENLQIDYDFFVSGIKYDLQLMPLLLFEDDDTLILQSSEEFQAILYNWRDNRVKRTNIITSTTVTHHFVYWEHIKDYVESLIPVF